MRFPVLLIAGALCVGLLIIGFVFAISRLSKGGNLQISLRGFLVFVALIAIVLAAVIGFRRETMASVEWIDAASPLANQLFPAESISPNPEGKYEFTYFAKCRSIQKLIGPIQQLGNMSFRIDRESIRIQVEDEATATSQLAAIRKLDVVPPGTFVIRGKVVDRKGKPLAGATVDLMGPYVFINHFQTRDDGTITMPLMDGGSAPAGSGYYLRVRAKEETSENHVRWNTASFSLSSNSPEMVILVTVPND